MSGDFAFWTQSNIRSLRPEAAGPGFLRALVLTPHSDRSSGAVGAGQRAPACWRAAARSWAPNSSAAIFRRRRQQT